MTSDADQQHEEIQKILAERENLHRSGQLHWFHWLVVALSVVLTLVVWHFSHKQLEEKIQTRFERESQQIFELIVERLQRYEDALWSGVATIHAHGGKINFQEWEAFASALHINEKYPGINGIGVIHAVPENERQHYLEWQRELRPDFYIHPEHGHEMLLPISYIVPASGNQAAVGLDVAHETNRLQSALRAQRSGDAQISGPIVLVQDATRTPGFLFYAPFYAPNETPATPRAREDAFVGLVYAPFVVHKLMQGTLNKTRRNVEFSIQDEGQYIYDETAPENSSSGESARLRTSSTLSIYGRNWVVDVWSTPNFYTEASNAQPKVILASGLAIDLMLLLLFLMMSRANRRSLEFAKRMSHSYMVRSRDLQMTVHRLETTNQELEQFAYIASHDLQEPLRTLSNFTGLLKEKFGESDNEETRMAVTFIERAAQRMRNLVTGLMSYNRIGHAPEHQLVNCKQLLDDVCSELATQIAESGTTITLSNLPVLCAYPTELATLFQNLISNAIKFRRHDVANQINISCEAEGSAWHFQISDNGVGVTPENFERIFQIFRRLHRNEDVPGNGIGLASCKKIVLMHGGKIWVSSQIGVGSIFHFTLPREFQNEQED